MMKRKGLHKYWISSWFFLLLHMIKSTECTHDCHSGVIVNDVCYYLGRGLNRWKNGEESCKAEGGYLAAVRDASVHGAFQQLLRDAEIPAAWIGAYEETGKWSWIDGDVLSPQGCYTDNPLNRDLPNQVVVSPLTAEKCIDACKKANGDYTYAGTQNGTACFCGHSFGKYGTNKVCTIVCEGNTTSSISKWCGGINMNFVYSIGGAYGYYGYHQPNNDGGYQHCGIIDLHIETKMADEPCGRPLAYLCDSQSISCTGDGYYKLNNADRDCVYIGKTELNFYKALDKCERDHKGSLLSLNKNTYDKSHEKQIALKALLASAFPDKDTSKFWIGNAKSVWKWSVPGVQFRYTAFQNNYPNNVTKRCLSMSAVDVNRDPNLWEYGWKDEQCDRSLPYFCQGGTPHISDTNTMTYQFTSSTNNTAIKSTPSSPITTSMLTGPSHTTKTLVSTTPTVRITTVNPVVTKTSSTQTASQSSLSSVPLSSSSSVSTTARTQSVVNTKSTTSFDSSLTPSISNTQSPSGGLVRTTLKSEEPGTTVQPTTKNPPTGVSQTTASSGNSGTTLTSSSATPAQPPSTTGDSRVTTEASTKQITSTTVTTTTTKDPNQIGTTTLSGPNAGQSTDDKAAGLSLLEILLIVLLGILGLVILIVIIVLCCVFCKGRKHKVYAKGYDARPIAPVPNSGLEPNYDEFASTLSLNKYGPY